MNEAGDVPTSLALLIGNEVLLHKAKQFRGTIGQSGSFPALARGRDERSEFEHTR